MPVGINEQTRQVLANLGAVLRAAGTDVSKLVSTTVYLANLADFPLFNATYSQVLSEPYPARTTIEVGLPDGMLIEISGVAVGVIDASTTADAPSLPAEPFDLP